MITSDKYRMTFIFTPRTASTALEKAIIDGDAFARNDSPDHSTYRHQDYTAAKESRWPVYAVLREPNDWLCSLYAMHNHTGGSKLRPQLPVFNNTTGVLGVKDLLELHTFLNKWYVQPNKCTNQMDWIGDSTVVKYDDLDAFCLVNRIPKLERLNASPDHNLSLSYKAQALANIIWERDYNAYYTGES